jgi:hypothetical protein
MFLHSSTSCDHGFFEEGGHGFLPQEVPRADHGLLPVTGRPQVQMIFLENNSNSSTSRDSIISDSPGGIIASSVILKDRGATNIFAGKDSLRVNACTS